MHAKEIVRIILIVWYDCDGFCWYCCVFLPLPTFSSCPRSVSATTLSPSLAVTGMAFPDQTIDVITHRTTFLFEDTLETTH